MISRLKTMLLQVLTPDPRFETYAEPGKTRVVLIRDVLAGLIVALVAIPLAVGFSIASGLRPEQGIVAGALAGILGGIFGGSKYQVYGPTAAFIPLLSAIMAHYDFPFLILASLIAGVLIFLMGVFRLGDYFAKIPFSVTVGFTVGIAFSIALGQLPDALGSLQGSSPHALEKIRLVSALMMHPNLAALGIAVMTFAIIRICYKTSVFIPGPLIAIVVAVLLVRFAGAALPGVADIPVLADKFGVMHGDIFRLTLPGLGAHPVWALIVPTLSIVFIASLESLLSARMADRLANNANAHDPNRELVGQGVVNTVVPLLNGFPCTGAFARTATSIKAGAASPMASLFQGGFIILLMLFFAERVAVIPMACISGLLIYVACNMVKVEELRQVCLRGRIHAFLMVYTAVMTVATDLFIAVSTATAIYHLGRFSRRHVLAFQK